MRARVFVLVPFVLAAACAQGTHKVAQRGFVHAKQEHGYPMDDVLRVNHVQAKATHNSYHIETPGNTEPSWHYTHAPLDAQLEAQGVRGVEIDTRYVPAADRFEVVHVPFLDEGTTCRAFVDCLATMKGWSDAHRGHAPLLVQIEPKDSPSEDDAETYFAKMEKEILSAWPRERILTPDDVQRNDATLRGAVTTKGWPTLAETRGTILFYIDNLEHFRQLYTRGGKNLDGRLMFVDSKEDDPLAAVIVANDPTDKTRIDALASAGFLVRTRADEAGTVEQRQAALATGAHLLSSDFPLDFAIPEGTPLRCNPLTAPAGCTPSAIEDPTHLR
jgi:hypothetical protein